MNVVAVIPDFVEVFLGRADVEDGLPFEGAIPRQHLDFTIESLVHLDAYLTKLHETAESLPDQQLINVATAAGAYLGEVIRRNATRQYIWQNHAEFFASHPKTAGIFPFGAGTAALLADTRGNMTLPINKILRFIEEGPENSTHYYASLEINRP